MAKRTYIPAVVLAMLFVVGCSSGGGGGVSPPEQQVATPTFSPGAGTYTLAQKVSLADATTGSSIYFTTDGSTPTTASTLYSPLAPIALSSTTTIKAIAAGPSSYLNSAVAAAAYTLQGTGPVVSLVLSTNDQSELMASQPSVTFISSSADATTNTVVIDPTQQFRSIEGFGAAFTDSAAYLLMKVEQSSPLSGTLNDLFTRNGEGIGISFMRIPMGATDIALSVYSYDDLPVGQTDSSLAKFSFVHD